MLDLSVSSLYNILYRYDLFNNINENDESKLIDFLFKYLNNKGRDASILFQKLDFRKNNIMPRLINECSEIFNFDMVNPQSLMQILNEYSEIIKKKISVN